MNQIITLLVCVAFVANVNGMVVGSLGALFSSTPHANQKGKISKELLDSLGKVCSDCRVYQSACTKLDELKKEIVKLPVQPETPETPVATDNVPSERKSDRRGKKVTATDFLDEIN